jgi:hypothetical protein
MIEMIANLSETHTQDTIDKSVVVELDDDRNIVAMNTSAMYPGFPNVLDDHGVVQVALGDLTAQAWCCMRVSP